jgi:hypothetical protein
MVMTGDSHLFLAGAKVGSVRQFHIDEGFDIGHIVMHDTGRNLAVNKDVQHTFLGYRD